MVDSIFRRDYPVVQGGLLLIALMVMIVNLIVDTLYGYINPRRSGTGDGRCVNRGRGPDRGRLREFWFYFS